MRYKVLVTCKQMQESLDELLAEIPMPDFSFTTPELTKQGFTSSEMVELMKGHDAAIVGDDVVDESVLSVPGLRFVCKWGAGVDGIDFEAAEKMDISVVNTPGMFGEDVADLALSYLTALTRSTFVIDRAVRRGEWPRKMGRSLRQLRVVVYGMGDIGKNLAKRLTIAGVHVVGCDISQSQLDDAHQKFGVEISENLYTAAKGADAILVTVPLNEDTRSSVNDLVFSLMNQGSYLVNVARGAVVDEHHLVGKLKSGHLHGAALDVFLEEPLPESSPLREIDNVIFGSHNASNSDASVFQASLSALGHLQSFFTN